MHTFLGIKPIHNALPTDRRPSTSGHDDPADQGFGAGQVSDATVEGFFKAFANSSEELALEAKTQAPHARL